MADPVTPASEFASAEHGLLWMASQYEIEKARADRAEAERDALRERLTLTDEDARWCEMVASDTRALMGMPAGSIEAALRDHLLSALDLIDRLTGEATDA